MALQSLPGSAGYIYARKSSMDRRAIGKLTDSNHLQSFHATDPADYDKKIITLYQQSSLYSNDFLNMINMSTPYYIDGVSDSWKWNIEVPYKFPKIIDVPADTLALSKVGIDGQEFQFVMDKADFYAGESITPHKMYGQTFVIIKDPLPWNNGFLYTAVLAAQNPKVEFVDKKYLQQGIEFSSTGTHIGEFDQDLPGLPSLGEKITMFESLGSASGRTHKITGWADDVTLRDSNGNPLDLLVFADTRRNGLPVTKNSVRWEPFIEFQLRKQMLEDKVNKMIWGKPGSFKTRGAKQEVKKMSAGVYHRMRSSGNYVPYNRGEFTANLLRSVFGDLFYRRVDVKNRKVKLYTNEAGFDIFQTAVKNDAFDSGLTFNVGDNNKFVSGSGQNLVLNFAFSNIITRETGEISLVHLKELDLPQSNLEFGQNKKSTPVFMVFDVSPNSDGGLNNNIREVRKKGRPSMTWGYIDGRRHHLGFAASQGHSASSMFDGYQIFMDDRYDVFIEDMTRTVLIEEIPQF
jgi:hypothetical protein